MYIPIMKNRDEEMLVMYNMNNYFGETIIPLIEIIKDKYDTKYEIDPKTGDFIYEKKPNRKKRNKIKLPPVEEDIITLDDINKRINGKMAFIDFFRFSENEYDQKSFKGVELSVKLSRDYDYYKKRLLETKKYPTLIPVVSIKSEFNISNYDFKELLDDLRMENKPIAIRLEDKYLDDYHDVLEEVILDEDFIFFDIREKNVQSKFIELEEFTELESNAKKILLNSPRPSSLKNGDFENLELTKKIDNQVAKEFETIKLDGFGDFGGLKDSLPTDAGSNGTGAALGLIFLKNENAFFSIVNNETKLGVRGYKYVRDEIIKRLDYLDENQNCLAIERIKNMSEKYGSWKTWNNITLTRYIQQQATK
ncbi:hypothetical protein Q9251_22230 [Alkalihalobacillus macyae]|uniref:beta family protein n=1 Tax=Guptibacillus hwajinpoensis TaxID=208199 RepID=UPI00273B9B85|nr:hypothetical protein [Alkalihalobacillus macyae]MDP4553570.1 hypothetical protein [Alkalihalobacillus macyae]